MTVPAGTIVDDASVTVPSVRFPDVIAVVAAACVRPTTLGTVMSDGPDDTVSAIAEPGATAVPAAGVELMTMPAGTVALDATVTVPRIRPVLVIATVACACDRPVTSGTRI